MSIDLQRAAHKAFIRRVGYCADEGGGNNILGAFGGGLLEVPGGMYYMLMALRGWRIFSIGFLCLVSWLGMGASRYMLLVHFWVDSHSW